MCPGSQGEYGGPWGQVEIFLDGKPLGTANGEERYEEAPPKRRSETITRPIEWKLPGGGLSYGEGGG